MEANDDDKFCGSGFAPEQLHLLYPGKRRREENRQVRELKGFASLLGKDTAMAVEATGNTFMFCRFLKAHVGQLVVVNPSQFKVISTSTKKTDKHDAKILAEFLEKDMLPEVRMKDDLQAKISSLTQTREKLVQLRTVLKNKVNNLLAAADQGKAGSVAYRLEKQSQ